jgi:hypothetical protein
LNGEQEGLTVKDATGGCLDINISDTAISVNVIGEPPKSTVVDVFKFEGSIEEELQSRVFRFFGDLHRA